MIRGLILVGLFSVLATGSIAERPHVVMAFADDWGRYAGVYGKLQPGGVNDIVKTPNFDAIAQSGVLFTNAFVSAPSCTPCRSSLLSGRPFWQCGKASILSGAVWDFSLEAYPLLLQDDGYRIGQTYKVWSPGTPGDAPHGGRKCQFESAGRRFNSFSQFAMAQPDREAAKQLLLQEVRDNIRSFLDGNDDGVLDGDDPVCYFFGPTNVHRKWIAGSGKELWGIDPDQLRGRMPAYLPDTDVIRQDFADYLGEAAAFDAALAVLDEELRRVGIIDDTVLVVSGDHGIPGFTHGKCNLYPQGTRVPLAVRWPNGIEATGRVVTDFVSLPELASTFVEMAGIEKPEPMIARSILPLLISDKDGRIDPSRDCVFTGRERHVDVARAGNRPYPQRAIQTDDFLYIINFAADRSPSGDGPDRNASPGEFPSDEQVREETRLVFADFDAGPTKAFLVKRRSQYPLAFEKAFGKRPSEELYDMRTDTDCMTNLAGKSSFADVKQRLRDRLMNRLIETDDPRVGENVIFESGFFVRDARRKK